MQTKHYLIRGRVQGVSFRANTRAKAQNLGLKGSVKNLSDGSVEVLATGDAKVLAEFETWLRNGPVFARVDELIIDSVDVQHFDDFMVQY